MTYRPAARSPLTRRRAAGLLAGTIAVPGLAAVVWRERDDAPPTGPGPIAWPDGGATGTGVGDRAPNFRLATLGEGTTTLAAQLVTGRPVVLNIFATWCASCRDEIPVLDAAHGTVATVLGIDLREDAIRVRELVDETGARYPVLLDRDGSVSQSYGAIGLPMTCVLAPDGTIRRWIVGPVSQASLRDAIDAAKGWTEQAGG